MTPDNVTQKQNVVAGDQAGRDLTKCYISTGGKLSPLGNLMAKLREEIKNEVKCEEMLPALKRYKDNVDPEGIIGLEEKLKRGKRDDLIKRAMFYKEQFVKELSEKQLHQAAQEIYVELLEIVFHRFRIYVTPAICEGLSTQEVDKVVSEQITYIMDNFIMENRDLFSQIEIEGMFYFLTGGCHIRWDRN
jgi:hypothetical protein